MHCYRQWWLAAIMLLIPLYTLADQEAEPFRIGYLPLLNQLPLVISYENDRADFIAIRLKPIKFETVTALEAALQVNAIDAAYIPSVLAFKIYSVTEEQRKSGIKIIGALHQGGNRIVVDKLKNSTSFKNTIIGVSTRYSAENIDLNRCLKEMGFRQGLDYKTLTVPLHQAVPNLKTGNLNALFLPEPYGTIAETENAAVEDKTVNEYFSGRMSMVLVVQADVLLSRVSAVEAWLQSLMNACHFIEQDILHKQAAQCAVIQSVYLGFSESIVKASLAERKGGLSFAPFTPAAEILQQLADQALEYKLINRSVQVENLMAVELMKNLLAEPETPK